MVHPRVAKYRVLVKRGAKSSGGETQHSTRFDGNRIAVIRLRTKACFRKKAPPRALQDNLRPISSAPNQPDFSGDDTKYTLQRISEPEQRLTGLGLPGP